MNLDRVWAREIEFFRARKVQTHTTKTITTQLCVLRRMLNMAFDWELLDSFPKFRRSMLPESTHSFLELYNFLAQNAFKLSM